MSQQSPSSRGRARIALTIVACIAAPMAIGAASADAAKPKRGVTYTIKKRTLVVNGSRRADAITLRVRSAAPKKLEIDVGDNGSTDHRIARSRFDRISVRAGDGRDRLRIDDAQVAFTLMTPTTLAGDRGADTIIGGQGAEVLRGGRGNDRVDGNRGNDTALLGRGQDRFQWDPGDGSDVVEGQQDVDQLVFNGSAAPESFDVSAVGRRVRFFRDVGNVTLDLDGVEKITTNALAGSDTMTVNDVSGTALRAVRTDLAGTLGGPAGDGEADRLVVNATDAADAIAIAGAAGALDVSGLAARVTLARVDAGADSVTVNGLGGADTIDASRTAADTLAALALNGGDLDDVLVGSAGNDTLDGGRGNDVARMGAGDDAFAWDPGDGSDTVEGQDGSDRLLFNGSGAAESFDVSAVGQRVRFFRDVASITMDLDDVENITTNALGGADTMTVNDVSGTDLKAVDADLAATAGGGDGDGQADRVIVDATNGADTIAVASADGAVSVAGLAALVQVRGSEAADALTVNALGGDDNVSSTLPAGSMKLTVDAGDGDDTVRGGDGDDVVIGGSGADFVDGNRGADLALLGDGDDRFQWDPGDGSDTVEGQGGSDRLLFNGAAVAERFDVSAVGQRVRFFRDVGNVTLDLDDVESITTNALGGADTTTVDDVSGTDLKAVDVDLAGALGGQAGDGQVDQIVANGTDGDDAVVVAGANGAVTVSGLPAAIAIRHAEAADELVVNGLGGNDSFDSAGLAAGTITLSTVQ
jgi:Ca2+-binding RTX toxin-like protein